MVEGTAEIKGAYLGCIRWTVEVAVEGTGEREGLGSRRWMQRVLLRAQGREKGPILGLEFENIAN
jgi:hypothetical protein